jgi:hypothetical protein
LHLAISPSRVVFTTRRASTQRRWRGTICHAKSKQYQLLTKPHARRVLQKHTRPTYTWGNHCCLTYLHGTWQVPVCDGVRGAVLRLPQYGVNSLGSHNHQGSTERKVR